MGDDQLPHLELTREISRRFNALYKKNVFPQPEALLTGTARLLGTDGRKMSKSYDNYIALSDEPDAILKKVQSMFTVPLRIRFSDPGHPDKCNVHSYYAVFAPERKREIDCLCRQSKIGCTECKKELAAIMVKYLEPIQEKRNRLLKNKNKLLDILDEGASSARSIALETIAEVKELLGMQIIQVN